MSEKPASQQIDDIIKLYGGWKGETLSKIRALIAHADPEITEEVKWKMRSRPEGLPVWSHDGIVCLTETFKNDIKLVFFKGAQMDTLQGHFNARLKSKTERAIELHEGDTVEEAAIRELVVEGVRLNKTKKR